MKTNAVTDVIAALREERLPLAARLDAIDLAIENLSRVYGINGTPQPLPLERQERRAKPRVVKQSRKARDGGVAAERREQLLAMIGRSEIGLTLAELKKQTPAMGDKDRTNAIQILRMKGAIKRSGNCWVKAA